MTNKKLRFQAFGVGRQNLIIDICDIQDSCGLRAMIGIRDLGKYL